MIVVYVPQNTWDGSHNKISAILRQRINKREKKVLLTCREIVVPKGRGYP